MTALYTWDIFSTLDADGSYGPDGPDGNWGGYWGKQGPQLLDHRFATYDGDHRMILGANTFRQFVGSLGSCRFGCQARSVSAFGSSSCCVNQALTVLLMSSSVTWR